MHLHFVYLLAFLLAGAAVHIAQLRDRTLQRGAEIALFASHGLVAVLLVVALVFSGAWRRVVTSS